jgi:hypothetical protein
MDVEHLVWSAERSFVWGTCCGFDGYASMEGAPPSPLPLGSDTAPPRTLFTPMPLGPVYPTADADATYTHTRTRTSSNEKQRTLPAFQHNKAQSSLH